MNEPEGTWLGLPRRLKPLVRAGVVLGLGIGGFFDGIVLHQVLQWHHMISASVEPTTVATLELNVLADGFFHVATYVLTIVGIALLWGTWDDPSVPKSRRAFVGSTIIGWGLFNFVEGLVNHHILGVHHVWPAGPGPVILWDAAFLAWGLLFIAGGYAIVRGDESVTGAPDRTELSTAE
jgi:uncharacterized membrane protein